MGFDGLRPAAEAMRNKALPDGKAMAFGQGLKCGAQNLKRRDYYIIPFLEPKQSFSPAAHGHDAVTVLVEGRCPGPQASQLSTIFLTSFLVMVPKKSWSLNRINRRGLWMARMRRRSLLLKA